jgi:flagellar motor switch protein FliM
MEQPAAPVTFLDHLRSSAKPASSEPVLDMGKSRQLANTVQRAFMESLDPGLEFDAGAQQLSSVSDWTSSLDTNTCILAHSIEDKPGETTLITFDRRTAIFLSTVQFGGASMLGLTDTGRALSGIEEDYLAEFGAALLPAIRTSPLSDAQVRLIDPQSAKAILPPDCMLTLFSFGIRLEGTQLNFVLLRPAEAAPNLSAAPAPRQADSAWKSAISSELTRSNIRLEAIVDLAPLTLSRLRVLIPGDIIPIPEGNLGRTALVSRGETMLTGRLGKFGGSYTVRVTSTASEKSTPLQGAIANRQKEKRP